MKRSLISGLASLLLVVDVRAAEPRWTVEFKEGAYTFLTATDLEVGQKTGPGAIAGYLVVKLPADVDPATTNRGVFLGRGRMPERRVTWLNGDEFAAGELLPAHHLIAITPNAGFEPGLWAVKVRDTVKDRSGRPVNPTNATWTVEIGEPRVRPDDPGPARNTLKLKFTTEVAPATYADGIVVERQVAGGWEEEPRGSATIAPREHGGSTREVGLRPLGGWERGVTYRVRVTDAIRDVRGHPLTNAEDFSFAVPKSGPFDTRHEPRRPVAQASAQAASAGPAFPGGQAMGWHGHWTDPVTGLIYMRHRWYDPRTGTFLSPDPMEDLDSPNLYLFGAGRPHEVVDPLGMAVTVKAEVPGAPCNVLPSIDMETGRYRLLDTAVLGPISSLENAGRKALNTLANASCAIGAGVDRMDESLWEKGILCRGCTTFGVDIGFSLFGTAEGSFARDVTSVYSRALRARPPPKIATTGETRATLVGKDVHATAAIEDLASGHFSEVGRPIRDANGTPIKVAERVDLKTGQPVPGSPLQQAVPDAVSFDRFDLILDYKPAGRPLAKDRQEIIRFIRAFEAREGRLPGRIVITRYDPVSKKLLVSEIRNPSDFLPSPPPKP